MKRLNYRPICNKNPNSAPVINGKTFILCWRCTSSIFAAAACSFVLFFLHISYNFAFVIIAFLLCVPAIIDFTLTKLCVIKQSNMRRIVTGFLLGGSIALFVDIIFNMLYIIFAF